MNINDYSGVLVYVEQRLNEVQNVSLELLGKGRKIADELGVQVTAALIGKNIDKHAKLLIEYGADKVLVLDHDALELYSTEPYTQAMVQAVQSINPEIVLFGATSIGRDLAPRVSARLLTGLTADCTSLEVSEERMLLMTRPAFGGNIMATIISPDHRPQMSTVRPGVMTKMDRDVHRTGEIVQFPLQIEKNNNFVEILSFEKETEEKQDIQEATVLVSGGRGVGSQENFGLLYDLADELNGLVSASRASVDAGWMDHDRQFGQTGKTVRPNLYFACGISGAIQHVAGMEEAELIVAINKDKDAKIFEYADLGIVGDVHKVLPFLIEEIKKINLTKKIQD
ncbi:MAG TPA: electron transfer flavoprotein subunit alpha/FixB family protein [Fusibacter sp.]|nr:electron transfer flavoprotein subunit alpha/FixB family protein [Fusibacter sp.]